MIGSHELHICTKDTLFPRKDWNADTKVTTNLTKETTNPRKETTNSTKDTTPST
jgi:hypothetical protein